MNYSPLDYPERTACEVLDEMRMCVKTLNFAALRSLIEEVQIMCNRMEAGLERKRNINDAEEHVKALRAEIKELKAKKEAHNGSKG